jgi:hypothetical protein
MKGLFVFLHTWQRLPAVGTLLARHCVLPNFVRCFKFTIIPQYSYDLQRIEGGVTLLSVVEMAYI